MWGWLREFRNVWNEPTICSSCELLKVELSNERLEKQRLLNRLLAPQLQEPERLTAPEVQVPIGTKHIPWRVRQQMLEQADREKAQVIAEFKKRDAEARKANPTSITPATTIEELEQNLGIVEEK